MPDPFVRTLGTLEDIDGIPVKVGVDYDTVSIQAGDTVVRLGQYSIAPFGMLFTAACYDAGQSLERPPDTPETCQACWHMWRLHGPGGCTGKVFPAHSLTGEPCPCEHEGPPGVQT